MADEKPYRVRSGVPLYWIGRNLIVPAFKLVSGYEITGRENVPKSGPVILAATHRSYLDIPFLAFTTRRTIHFMAKADLWDKRVPRWFCANGGAFPVRRGLRDRQSLEAGISLLEQGGILGIFPEGRRVDGPAIQDLHGGCVYLAQKGGAAIVPVAICGSGNLMGADSKLHPFTKVRVDIGEPISVPPETGYRGRQEHLELLRVSLQRQYSALRRLMGEPSVDDVGATLAD